MFSSRHFRNKLFDNDVKHRSGRKAEQIRKYRNNYVCRKYGNYCAYGSTIPESTPPANAFDFFIPSAFSGIEITAPSGKF